jgi:hypothetical protein
MWTAFYAGNPVAYATLASAIKHRDIFNEPVFAEATVTSAKVNGVRRGLSDMGFIPYKYTINVKGKINDVIAKHVSTAKSTVESEFEDKHAEYNDRLLAALSTAAIGINRGFFRNSTNPIKSSLWSSLSAAGIRNPETIIDNVFAAQADSYHKILFDKALEIISKSLDVQNELASTVMDSNYMNVSSANTTESSLVSIGSTVPDSVTSTSNNNVSTNAPEQFSKRISNVISTLGRRR